MTRSMAFSILLSRHDPRTKLLNNDQIFPAPIRIIGRIHPLTGSSNILTNLSVCQYICETLKEPRGVPHHPFRGLRLLTTRWWVIKLIMRIRIIQAYLKGVQGNQTPLSKGWWWSEELAACYRSDLEYYTTSTSTEISRYLQAIT